MPRVVFHVIYHPSTRHRFLEFLKVPKTRCFLRIFCDDTGGPKVYDVTSYLDDHPGGAEVLMDCAGADADEFFEDIGHSSDARNELKKLLVGTLKLTAEEMEAIKKEAEMKAAKKSDGGMNTMVIVLVLIIAIAAAYYKTQM